MIRKFAVAVLTLAFFAIICLAPTSDPYDGTGWDVTAPDIDQPHGKTYLELQDLRKGVAVRMNKEHVTLASSSAGGEHKNGAAVTYEGTSEPSDRPDGSTALANNAYDRGRLWLDDNFNPPVLKRWDGSAWEVIGTIAGTAPRLYMHNTTHEDTENNRESQIWVYGEQSGGEKSTLGIIEISHDGTGDDQKGQIRFIVNDGDDNNSLHIVPINFTSTGIDVPDSAAVLDEDDMSSNDPSRLATQQSIKAYADTKLAKDGSVAFTGTGAGFKDEDDMASNSATATASQQSIKKYVDDQIDAKSFGSYTIQDDESNTMVVSHAYLANQDGFVIVITSSVTDQAAVDIIGYVDTDTNPASGGTILGRIKKSGTFVSNQDIYQTMFPVASGKYFEITASNATVNIYWQPIGTLSKPTDQD